MSKKGPIYAFIAGMPESVEELLQALSQVDNMDISEVQAWAWAKLKKGPMTMEQAAGTQSLQCQMKETNTPTTCYKCDGPNHQAWDYLLQHKHIQKRGAKTKIPFLCYKCKKWGCIVQECPVKQGDETPAPVFFQNPH